MAEHHPVSPKDRFVPRAIRLLFADKAYPMDLLERELARGELRKDFSRRRTISHSCRLGCTAADPRRIPMAIRRSRRQFATLATAAAAILGCAALSSRVPLVCGFVGRYLPSAPPRTRRGCGTAMRPTWTTTTTYLGGQQGHDRIRPPSRPFLPTVSSANPIRPHQRHQGRHAWPAFAPPTRLARCGLALAAALAVALLVPPKRAGATAVVVAAAAAAAGGGGGTKAVVRSLVRAFRHPQVTALLLVALHGTRDVVVDRVLPILSTVARRFRPRRRHVVAAAILGLAVASTLDLLRVKRRQAADATSEWSRYAEHPGARGRAAVALLLQILPLYLASKLPLLRARHRHGLLTTSGSLFADGLLKLGPLYIKLGQIVSCRDKLLPEEWKGALERLQDQVPSRKGQDALDLAYAAWPSGKEHFHSVFSEFDTTPLAAASLGQVHRATLASTGASVAIKLQRPHLRQIYDQDLALMTRIAAFADRFGGSAAELGGISQSWVEIFQDAEAILYREIDYRDEARHILRFCNDFGLALGGSKAESVSAVSRDGEPLPSAAPWLRTPIVYEGLSSEKVLVMEFVPSIKITNREGLLAANVTADDMEYLADMLARSYLRQFCCNLFFSTDPHPGNLGVEILRTDAPSPSDRVRLVYYDFGQAATLNQNQADGILTIIEAIVDTDVDRSMEAFQQMGVLKEGADLDKVRAKVADNYKTGKVKANRKRLKKKGYKLRDAHNSTSTTSPADAASDSEVVHFFTLPAEYAFVGRALSQMDGVGKFLDSEFDFVSSAAPWIYEIKGATKYLKEEAIKMWNKFVKESVLDHILPTFDVSSAK